MTQSCKECLKLGGSCPQCNKLGVEYYREGYDANTDVCQNQDDFNQAFYNAVKYNNKTVMDKNRTWLFIYGMLYIVFMIWAVSLALKIPAGSDRTMHLLFAILFGPLYVLAYYIGIIKQ